MFWWKNILTSFRFKILPRYYYRTNVSGDWENPGLWLHSIDNVSFSPAINYPDSSAKAINIRNGHSITVTANASATKPTVEPGGSLTNNDGVKFTVK